MEEFIRLEEVVFSFGGDVVLDGINEVIYKNEAFFIIGSSGSGKSTFLKLCAGLYRPDKGNIIFDGVNIARAGKMKLMELHKRSGFVFQDAALISNLKIFDNIALPLRYHTNMSESDIGYKVDSILKIIDMDKDKNLFPSQLSLGERKLVAMGRILVSEPEIIFYDEPLSSLDPISAKKVSWLINDFLERKITSIIITHRMNFASKVADRIAIMHEGKILESDKYDKIKNSKNKFVQDILGTTIR